VARGLGSGVRPRDDRKTSRATKVNPGSSIILSEKVKFFLSKRSGGNFLMLS
jgi:hypothetical protein